MLYVIFYHYISYGFIKYIKYKTRYSRIAGTCYSAILLRVNLARDI